MIKQRDVNMTSVGAIDPNKPAYTEYTLCFEGRKCVSTKTKTGHEVMQELCDKWNEQKYQPDFSNTTLLHEMNATQRKKLDDLCAKSVPDLFPVESEVKP